MALWGKGHSKLLGERKREKGKERRKKPASHLGGAAEMWGRRKDNTTLLEYIYIGKWE